jgi:hypothetical protein
MHDAWNSYTQYVPIGYRLLGRYLDKVYNSVPGGVGSNNPHDITNKTAEFMYTTKMTSSTYWRSTWTT